MNPADARRKRYPHATTSLSDFTASDFLNRFIRAISGFRLKGEAVATRSKEAGVAIARRFDTGEKLLRRVKTAVGMAVRIVPVLWDWHSGACCFANIERRTVAAEYFYGRPFWQHRNGRRRECGKFIRRVNNVSADNCEDGFDAFEFFLRNNKVVIRERNEIG
jgi:hypothetical protein